MLKNVLGMVAVFGLALAAAASVLNTPEGYYNSVTGECIAIVTKEGVVSCKNAPAHNPVFVSPEVTFASLQAKMAN
jgi:hypothetical protein